jgi:hypothetical protein
VTVASAEISATFVEVKAAQSTVTYTVLPLAQIFGIASAQVQGQLSLRATAGYKVEVCDVPPLLFCNPNEAGGHPGANFNVTPGVNILGQVNTSALQPGDWAVVNVPNAQNVQDAMGLLTPNTQCFSSLVIKTGNNAGPVQNGLNVRFDEGSDSTHPPAKNVLKGEMKQNCNNFKQSSTSIPLPRDSCFMTALPVGDGTAGTGCLNDNNGVHRVGDGNWARNTYWTINHPMQLQPGGYATMSRHDVYQYEIANPPLPNIGDENAGPSCATPPAGAVDRRLITVAIVNCLANANDLNNGSPIPLKVFAKLFLTEPVGHTDWFGVSRAGATWGSPPNNFNAAIFAEMVGIVPPNDPTSGVHIYPTLYR